MPIIRTCVPLNNKKKIRSTIKCCTVVILSFLTDRSRQVVQTQIRLLLDEQIRLLLEEQSVQGLSCLLFYLDVLEAFTPW